MTGRVPCVACLATSTWRVLWNEPTAAPVGPPRIEHDQPACDAHLVTVVRGATDVNGGHVVGVRPAVR